MADYLDKDSLTKELTIFISTGEITPELRRMIEMMASGLQQRYGRGIDVSDFTQNCWMILLLKGQGIDLTQNTFAYLTTCFLNELRRMYRSRKVDGEPTDPSDFAKFHDTAKQTRELRNDY